MRPTAKRAYTRRYVDTNQLSAIVEWSDGGVTYGDASEPLVPKGRHMKALFERAKRDGVTVTHEEF